MIDSENGDIIIYQTDDGLTKIDVKFKNETVWLSQQQMAELFSTSRTNLIEYINNIYLEEELDKKSTYHNFRQVLKEGNRNVSREIPFYNLDMIISLGYRIKSKVATNFRKLATERLNEYMIKGFTMDDERLKGNGVKIRDVADTLGHKYIETTENLYMSSTNETIKNVSNVFDILINSKTINEIIKYESAY